MKKYSIPVNWQSYKIYNVEAENLQDAVTKALKLFFQEPDEKYLDDSVEIDAIVDDNYSKETYDIDKAFADCTKEPLKHGFIALSVLGLRSYQPVFHEDENLMFFDTEEEANAEIKDCIDGVAEAVENGDMTDTYDIEDYTVVPATLQGTRIECVVNGQRYWMNRTDDDFQPIENDGSDD